MKHCPNCGAKWDYEEIQTDTCDACNWPHPQPPLRERGEDEEDDDPDDDADHTTQTTVETYE